MQKAALSGQRVNNRLNVVAMPIGRRRMQNLCEKLPVFARKNARRMAQTAPCGQDPNNSEQIMQCPLRIRLSFLDGSQRLFETLDNLSRVKNQSEDLLKTPRRDVLPEESL